MTKDVIFADGMRRIIQQIDKEDVTFDLVVCMLALSACGGDHKLAAGALHDLANSLANGSLKVSAVNEQSEIKH